VTETASLSELETRLSRLPADKRAALLAAVLALFAEQAERLKPSQVKIFDRLFKQLALGLDAEEVAGFSRRIAGMASAPPGITEYLARHDDITIAEPVLMRSACVAASTLVEIARTIRQTHLLAIACRPKLDSGLVDILVARGDDVVARYVTNNRGAQISETSAVALAERAKNDDAVAELLGKRSDIPPHLRAVVADAAATF